MRSRSTRRRYLERKDGRYHFVVIELDRGARDGRRARARGNRDRPSCEGALHRGGRVGDSRGAERRGSGSGNGGGTGRMTEASLNGRRRPVGPPARLGTTLLEGPIVITGASGQVGHGASPPTGCDRERGTRARESRRSPRAAVRDAAAVVHLARDAPPRAVEHLRAGQSPHGRADGRGTRWLVRRASRLPELRPGRSTLGERRTSVPREMPRSSCVECGRDCVVFRCTHIVGPPDDPGPMVSALLARRGHTASGPRRRQPAGRAGLPRGRRRRDRRGARSRGRTHGRFDLAGPEEMSMDDLVRIVNGERASGSATFRRWSRAVPRRVSPLA